MVDGGLGGLVWFGLVWMGLDGCVEGRCTCRYLYRERERFLTSADFLAGFLFLG